MHRLGCGKGAESYRLRMSVTLDPPLSIVAFSPRREVTVPRRRTVEVEGREVGEKACRCLGRIRGVAWDIVERAMRCDENQ